MRVRSSTSSWRPRRWSRNRSKPSPRRSRRTPTSIDRNAPRRRRSRPCPQRLTMTPRPRRDRISRSPIRSPNLWIPARQRASRCGSRPAPA
ncbi:MAG: hypothetical protein EON86_16405 [Brevundimonas sp.]|nr:MAG: hypothetical protein EON86_16405 [Brevundimonas sp.]